MGYCHCCGYKTILPLDFIPQDEKKIIERGKLRKLSKKDPKPRPQNPCFSGRVLECHQGTDNL